MSFSLILLVVGALTLYGYAMGRRRALSSEKGERLHSLPQYYGYYIAIWCGVPAVLLLALWVSLETSIIERMVLANLADAATLSRSMLNLMIVDIRNLATGGITSRAPDAAMIAAAEHYKQLKFISLAAAGAIALSLCVGGLVYARSRIAPSLRARNSVERSLTAAMVVCSTLAILTTVGIVLSLLFESARFFSVVPLGDFLFGLQWSPQTALRADQVGASGAFGAVPLFAGTMLITLIAMAVAVPVGLLSAIYMADYAPDKVRAIAKPALEVLAGIPTVVFGFFAALTVAPFIRDLGPFLHLDIASESAIAAGLVMGVMIVPFVSSLCDDVIHAVPQSLRHGAYGLGATKSETIRQVVLPAALPGIVAAVMLATSKAIGETMIVAMAAGLAANLTANPFDAVTTVTVQIATLLVGDQEFDSPKTLSAFALGLLLFCVTLLLNVIALKVVNKYREKYD